MSEMASMTTTHQMYRALSALRLEVPASIADDVAEKVIAVVDAANVRATRLAAALRMAREALREYHGGCGVPDEPCLAREALAVLDAALEAEA